MTASELFCRQAGLAPQGALTPTPAICAMCGQHIAPGQHRSTFRPSGSFMDTPELCAGSNKLCGFCVHLTDKQLMFWTQNACITETGVMPARRLAHKQWLLLNPPTPPFVLIQSDTTLSHLIWRTPITTSKDFWYLRISGRQFTIRFPLVNAALERFDLLAKRFEITKPKWPLRHPFTNLDFNLRDPAAWELRRDVAKHFLKEDHQILNQLRPGEFWALTILAAKPQAEKPPKSPKPQAKKD
jgi:CRISPR type IV-associated protein Csf1